MSESGLQVEALDVVRGGRLVVAGVALEVRPGEVTALLGPNGAGKSSTVLALAGVLPRAGGRVTVDGTPISGLGPDVIRRAGVAAVLEGHRVLADLTVEDNLRVATALLPRRRVDAAIGHVLETFPELRTLLGRSAGLLSGGEQQMLALAQALVTSPRYLLIDELSFGLAPIIVRRLVATLEQVAAEGTGILLVEQFTQVALRLAVRAAVLRGGSVLFAGAAQELSDTPEILHSAYLAGEDDHPGDGVPSPTMRSES